MSENKIEYRVHIRFRDDSSFSYETFSLIDYTESFNILLEGYSKYLKMDGNIISTENIKFMMARPVDKSWIEKDIRETKLENRRKELQEKLDAVTYKVNLFKMFLSLFFVGLILYAYFH